MEKVMDRNKMNEAVQGCRNKLEQVYRLGYENGRLDEIESYNKDNKDNKNEENIFNKFCSCMTCKHILVKLSKRGWNEYCDTVCTNEFNQHINPLWCCANYERDKNWQDLIKKIILLG